MRSEEKDRRAAVAAAARLVLDQANEVLQGVADALPTIPADFRAALVEHGLNPALQLATELGLRALATEPEGRACAALLWCAARLAPVARLPPALRGAYFVMIISGLADVRGRLDAIKERGAKAASAARAERPRSRAAAIRVLAAAGVSTHAIVVQLAQSGRPVEPRNVRKVRSKIV